MPKFSTLRKYVHTDVWRGYYEPVYAVAGWNDTGTWSDSPCNTAEGIRESKIVKAFLRKHGIPYRHVVCRTSNVFCIHHYLIVPVERLDECKQLLAELQETVQRDMRLLYLT